ncbi:MAG: chitobiase/beta-hexosaminidase C-terminal domain-containing protein [Paludibacteraceae bacterium]
MRAQFISLLFCLFVGLNVCRAALPEGYTYVSDIATLQDGDCVVLYAPTIYLGVTGWDGKSDATVAASGWAEYVVETTTGGVYLKDAALGKYISNPSSTTFAYSETPMLCILGTSNRFKCGSRYLCQSPISGGYAYRFYTSSTGDYKPFFLYKVPEVSVKAPTLSPAEGAVAADGSFTAPFLLTMTCATEGAQIYYTTDGTDPVSSESRVLYLSPLTISETTTLRVIATDGTDNSEEVKATYTLKKGYAESIAEFIAAAPTSAYELRLSEAQEAIIIGICPMPSQIYLQDRSGKGIIVRTTGLTLAEGAIRLGHQLVGSLFGIMETYEGKPRIQSVTIGEDMQFLPASRPSPTTITAVDADTYQAHPLTLVTIKDVMFSKENKIKKDGVEYGYQDEFDILSDKTLPDDTTLCNLTGILTAYSGISYKLIPVLLSDIDTKEEQAALPTIFPIGGSTQDEAIETEQVHITPIEKTTIWINDSSYTSRFSLPITEECVALTLVVRRDFYSDNTLTIWYKSPTTPSISSILPTTSNNTPCKVFMGDQLVIKDKSNHIYDVQGRKVK